MKDIMKSPCNKPVLYSSTSETGVILIQVREPACFKLFPTRHEVWSNILNEQSYPWTEALFLVLVTVE
jgi:hypothetical protein